MVCSFLPSTEALKTIRWAHIPEVNEPLRSCYKKTSDTNNHCRKCPEGMVAMFLGMGEGRRGEGVEYHPELRSFFWGHHSYFNCLLGTNHSLQGRVSFSAGATASLWGRFLGCRWVREGWKSVEQAAKQPFSISFCFKVLPCSYLGPLYDRL